MNENNLKPGQLGNSFKCGKCLNNLSIEDVFEVVNCQKHQVCRDCAACFLLDYRILRCPVEGCLASMSRDEAILVIDDSEVDFCIIEVEEDENRVDSGFDAGSPALMETFDCPICAALKPVDETFTTSEKCGHRICRQCAAEHVEVVCSKATNAKFPCPIEGCDEEIDADNVANVVNFGELYLDDSEDDGKGDVSTQQFDCVICTESHNLEDVFLLSECDHEMCRDCAHKYVMSIIEDVRELTCPMPECKKPISIYDTEILLSPDEFSKLSRMLLNKATADCVQCPQSNCVGKAEVITGTYYFRCPVCRYEMCTRCDLPWHVEGDGCNQPVVSTLDSTAADLKMDEYVKTKKLQKCPLCKMGVELKEGCNHMECRCGAHFCYLCGLQFSSKNWEEHGSCLLFKYDHVN